MANRRAHKKLRAAIKLRMRHTGESYQKARMRILEGAPTAQPPYCDLVPFRFFGLPATLAVVAQHGHVFTLCLPSVRLWGRGYPDPLRSTRVWAAHRALGVQ